MIEQISTKAFLEAMDRIPSIDTRSPAEFENGHIPGAINFPIFQNEERKEVGTTYKQVGRNEAVLQGLDIIGPKLKEFASRGIEIAHNNQLQIYCWRGGMRSNSLAWLFDKVGLDVRVLNKGYKSYRRYCKKQLSNSAQIIILSGATGSGKTHILHKMKDLGEQVLDLEGLANHKGSAFGAMGQKAQLSNEQFENQLAYEWGIFDLSKTIWIEDESAIIGRNHIPKELFSQMRAAPVFVISIDNAVRLGRLNIEYAGFDKSLLIENINKIKKRLSPEKASEAIKSVNSGDISKAIEISLSYYDKAYMHGLNKRNLETVTEFDLGKLSIEECAKKLISSKGRING